MKTFVFIPTRKPEHDAVKNGQRYVARVIPTDKRVLAQTITAETKKKAIAAFLELQVPVPVPAKPLRALTKRELVDKLIEEGIAAKFNALLGTVPLEEKLRWEASPTISPEYPFIRDNHEMLCEALGITAEQLDNIFR